MRLTTAAFVWLAIVGAAILASTPAKTVLAQGNSLAAGCHGIVTAQERSGGRVAPQATGRCTPTIKSVAISECGNLKLRTFRITGENLAGAMSVILVTDQMGPRSGTIIASSDAEVIGFILDANPYTYMSVTVTTPNGTTAYTLDPPITC
jgi:hypothetical protein